MDFIEGYHLAGEAKLTDEEMLGRRQRQARLGESRRRRKVQEAPAWRRRTMIARQ